MIIGNGKIFVEETFVEGQVIVTNHHKIQGVEQRAAQSLDIDANGGYIIPGFVDLQLNGGGGAYYTNNLTEAGMKTIFEAYLKYGTTSCLPTLITSGLETILEGIELTRQLMEAQKFGVLGMHLEGPFFNPIKRGAHPKRFIRNPTDAELRTIIKHGAGVIKIITLAPELFTDRQLSMLKEAGFILSAGHSMATYQQAMASFEKGITKVTHLFNAMSPLQSRAPGLVGAALDSDIWTSIIVDGVHINYAAVRLAYQLKKESLFLITDAVFKDAPVEGAHLSGLPIVFKDGQYYTEQGNLAGSSLSMLEALQNAVFHVGIPLEAAVTMSTSRPAKVLGLTNVGKIVPNAKADLLILDAALNLKTIINAGKVINFESN